MPAIKTRSDSIREYFTGAGADGAAQAVADLCLGHFRSSTECLSYGIQLTSPLANLSIDYASGGNGPGVGTLTAVDANNVAWQDSLGSQGSPLTLSGMGSQGIVESLNRSAAYLRVTRLSTSPISGGPCSVNLSVLFDNFYGFDDVTVLQAAAGVNQYRASILRNEAASLISNLYRWLNILGTPQVSDTTWLSSITVPGDLVTSGSFADWPLTGFCRIQDSLGNLKEIVYYAARSDTTLIVQAGGRALLGTSMANGSSMDVLNAVPGIAIGADPAGPQAFGSSIQTIANQTTPPAGVSFTTGITLETGLFLGSLDVNQQTGIWIWRQIPSGASSTPAALQQLNTSFSAP